MVEAPIILFSKPCDDIRRTRLATLKEDPLLIEAQVFGISQLSGVHCQRLLGSRESLLHMAVPRELGV